MGAQTKERARRRRHARVRRKVSGTPERPRLAVYRSNRQVTVQVIDDVAGRTLAAASTLDADLPDAEAEGDTPGVAAARSVGRRIGERARELGVEQVVFDRGGYRYHGRVRAVAEGAREAGLEL